MSIFKKNYIVELQNQINSEDQETMLNLYQPIIGSSSISLYNTLIFENKWTLKIKSAVFSVQRLVELTGINSSSLEKNLGKLTKLNLLKIYKEKSTDNIIFVVKKPLSAKEFLSNKNLMKALSQKLSESNFEALVFYFKEKKLIDEDSEYISIEEDFLEKTDPAISNINFFDSKDTNNSLSSDTEWIEKKLLKNEINYNFNNEENLAIDNLISNYQINKNELLKFIINNFNLVKNSISWENLKIENLEEKNNKNKNSTNLTEKDKETISYMDSTDWNSYYEICLGDKPDEITINSIKKIIREYNFSDGIINCLISYSYQINNQNFIFKYVYKIAKTLFDHKFKNTKDVYNFLKQLSIAKSKWVEPKSSVTIEKSYMDENNTANLTENVNIEW